ncbi:MAG: serine dehydratase beta chain [Mycobacterium sp.]
MISVFELFKVGIGPSSSHTVGPMRAADRFVAWLADRGLLSATGRVQVELFGSLGATGKGHGTMTAVVLGLLGEHPEFVDRSRSRIGWRPWMPAANFPWAGIRRCPSMPPRTSCCTWGSR